MGKKVLEGQNHWQKLLNEVEPCKQCGHTAPLQKIKNFTGLMYPLRTRHLEQHPEISYPIMQIEPYCIFGFSFWLSEHFNFSSSNLCSLALKARDTPLSHISSCFETGLVPPQDWNPRIAPEVSVHWPKRISESAPALGKPICCVPSWFQPNTALPTPSTQSLRIHIRQTLSTVV